MDMLLTNDSPAYVEYINRHYYQIQKFYLVLHHGDDGAEYDGISCMSCLPWCRKPTYGPGQHISGHILIKPMQKMIITGVKILFEGLYKTKWKDKEHGLKWFGVHSFYKDYVNLISNRVINLDDKWYKFDFEHVLPQKLLSSIKSPEYEIIYHAAGCIMHPLHVEHVQTPYTRFNMDAPVNIRDFPRQLLEPVTRSSVKVIEENLKCISKGDDCDQHEPNVNDAIIIQNPYTRETVRTPSNDGLSLPSLHTSIASLPFAAGCRSPASSSDNEVISTLWLNKRVFTAGEEVLMELNVDNVTRGPVTAQLILRKTTKLKANYAMKKHSHEILIALDTQIEKTICDMETSLWSSTVGANAVESVTVNYKVPCKTPVSLPKLRVKRGVCDMDGEEDSDNEPIIQSRYTIELQLIPEGRAADSQTAASVEVWIASRDHVLMCANRVRGVSDSEGLNRQFAAMAVAQQSSWDDTELITYSDQRGGGGEGRLECDLTIETSLDDFAEHDHKLRTRSQSLDAIPTDSEGPPAYQAETANTV